MVLESATGDACFARHVFHRNGVPIGDFRKSWASACGKSGLTGRLFHDLRRTASRNMIAAGVPQVVAMKITGHRTDSVFRRYAIVDEEQKKQALASTAKYLVAAADRKIAVMPARKAGWTRTKRPRRRTLEGLTIGKPFSLIAGP
jgi:integrase